VNVEKFWDELWIGVKCQSNAEIAGSPRNSFRASLEVKHHGGRALIGCGARQGLPSPVKLRMPCMYTRESDSEC
jgi:hypothetical protein